MTQASDISNLAVGGLFTTAADFDIAVRRFNQDCDKLVTLARRNTDRIHHICLIQSREQARVAKLNKGKEKGDRVKPKSLCKGK